MKILILVDLLNDWALHNRAKAIKKFLPGHEVEVRAGLKNDAALIGQENFDVIHFNYTYGLTDHYNFIVKNRHRVLMTVVNERSLLIGFGVDQPKLSDLYRNSPHVSSVNTNLAEMLNCAYIPNGIDEDLFSHSKKVVVGYAGTSRDNKNIKAVIDACKILGLELRTAGYINGLGQLPHEKMNDFYRCLDVYVHASLTEGFNNTVIEALSCNVPVLMTRQGSWEEFDGWVDFIEPTAQGVIKGLRKYCGRKLVSEKFTWKKLIPQYEEIYTRIYEDNNGI